jgi:hypothetical protein
LVLKDLVLKNSKIAAKNLAQLHFIIDCFEYYNIKPNNITININSLGSIHNEKNIINELLCAIVLYNPEYKNIKVNELSSYQYLNNQLIITVKKGE